MWRMVILFQLSLFKGRKSTHYNKRKLSTNILLFKHLYARNSEFLSVFDAFYWLGSCIKSLRFSCYLLPYSFRIHWHARVLLLWRAFPSMLLCFSFARVLYNVLNTRLAFDLTAPMEFALALWLLSKIVSVVPTPAAQGVTAVLPMTSYITDTVFCSENAHCFIPHAVHVVIKFSHIRQTGKIRLFGFVWS